MGGFTGPGYSLLHLSPLKIFFVKLNNLSYFQDTYRHLTLCLRPMEPHWMSQESNPGDKSATYDSSNKKFVFVLSCFPCTTNKTKKEEKQA